MVVRVSGAVHAWYGSGQGVVTGFAQHLTLKVAQLLLQWLVSMVLLAVEIESQGVLGPLHGMVQPYQGARVVLVRILELHGDAAVLRDQAFGREGDLSGIVVDHVIVLLTANEQLSIDEHTLGAGEHDDDGAGIVAAQTIRPLDTFDPLDHVASELALADRHTRSDP